MVAVATLEASAPLVMVSTFAPPDCVSPVVAKNSEFTVLLAVSAEGAAMRRMLSVVPAVLRLLELLYSVPAFSRRTPFAP